jgi:hypothetical protein
VTWLTWRQQRTETFIAGGALGALVLGLVITRILMGHDYSALGGDCHGAAGALLACNPGPFVDKWAWLQRFLFSLYVVPVLLAIFFAIPLVAGEVERGTHRLVWTQSVTRTRWFAIKSAWIVGGGIVIGAVLSVLVTWWRQPFDAIAGTSMTPDSFDQEGIITVGVFLLALALAIAASAILHRTLPAIAVTLLVFALLRVAVVSLPPQLMPTVTVLPSSAISSPGTLSQVPVGLTVAQWSVDVPCPPQSPIGQSCQGTAVKIVTDAYFWPLQLVETGIYVALGVVLLLVALFWVRRRIA